MGFKYNIKSLLYMPEGRLRQTNPSVDNEG